MKTASHILSKKLDLDESWTKSNGITPKSQSLIEAMEEYAEQFRIQFPTNQCLEQLHSLIQNKYDDDYTKKEAHKFIVDCKNMLMAVAN